MIRKNYQRLKPNFIFQQSEEEHEPSHEKKKNKRIKAMSDSEEEEDEDDRHNEDLKDLIDDRPIEDDESDGDSDGSGRSAKRKKSDDDDELDDRLEDEDYDLIEENLGVKVERRVSDLNLLINKNLFFSIFRKNLNVYVEFKRTKVIMKEMMVMIVNKLLISFLLLVQMT